MFMQSFGQIMPRECEVVSKPSLRGGKRRSNPSLRFTRRNGLRRGACHRARIRATRWLAMTEEAAERPSRSATATSGAVHPSRRASRSSG
jgi:hypothetical protein